MRRAWILAVAAVLAATTLVASPAAADGAQVGSATGTGSVILAFHNREGVTEPATVSGTALGYRDAPAGTSTGPRMYLSDDIFAGTFALTYLITHRDVAAFDSFKVKNTGTVPIVMTYTHEDEFNFPSSRVVDDNQLFVCFLAGCDFGFWVPDGAVQPPVPLLSLAPGEEAVVKVGLKLAPDADWSAWNNYLRISLLHFEAVAA